MRRFPLEFTNAIHVDVTLKGPRDIRYITMVLDTGATLTTIPYEMAFGIGIDPTRSKRRLEIITASNREYASLITVPSFSLSGWGFSLKNVDVLCLDLPPSPTEASGLLGLNVLKEFDISLLFRKGLMEISR